MDEPCKAPCWYGLELGKTTKAEALSKVNSLPFIDPQKVKEFSFLTIDWNTGERTDDGTHVFFYCKNQYETCPILDFANNKLELILLDPGHQFTFAEVVDKLGNPDFVEATAVTPEIIDCRVSLIWMSRQMVIGYYERKTLFGKNLCDTVRQAGNKPPSYLIVQDIMYEMPEALKANLNDYTKWSGFEKP
jgi:hypothetical protein